MRRFVLRLTGWALTFAVAGLLFAWSGLYNVGASRGHWPFVAWFLHFAMQQSVETHAIALKAPDLASAALIERGAGHYLGGCAPCHGEPGSPGDLAARQMLPAPPELSVVVPEWTPEQLFWIVKHGLKYTGMPAWPALARDDEVWAVTAFLLRLPGMDRAEYGRLAAGEPAPTSLPGDEGTRPLREFTPAADPAEAELVSTCARCHGLDGVGRASGAFPRLDSQTPDYLFTALRDYATGVRASGIMEPIAAGLDEAQSQRLAGYYAGAPARQVGSPPAPPDPAKIEAGAALAARGAPDRQIASCTTCHGDRAMPSQPSYPSLAGQYPEYLTDQLRLWRSGTRGGSRAEIMNTIAANLSDEEIEVLSLYYASLPPPSP